MVLVLDQSTERLAIDTLKESLLVRQIIRTLTKTFGGKWIKIHGGIFQEAGLPDIIGVYQGRFFGLEVKTSIGRVSPRQRRVLKEIRAAGGTACVIRSIEAAIEAVNKAAPLPVEGSDKSVAKKNRRHSRRAGHRQDVDSSRPRVSYSIEEIDNL